MNTDHIMLGGYILRQGRGQEWMVGRPKERTIRGADTVEILSPLYYGSPDLALAALVAFTLLSLDWPPRAGGAPGKLAHGLLAFADKATVDHWLLSSGDIFRVERLKRGVTQKALAKRAGVSQRALREIERMRSSPKAETVGKLIRALHTFDG